MIQGRLLVISVDGNIGAGKSTVISNCTSQIKNIEIFLEPVDEWKELIAKCNIDPKTWGYKLQQKVLNHYKYVKNKIKRMKKLKNKGIKIIMVERSALTSVNVFAKLYLQQNIITSAQYDELHALAHELNIKYDKRIFINTPPEICKERVITRNRKCDRNSPFQYLKDIDALYQKMYETDDEKFMEHNQMPNKPEQEIKKKLVFTEIRGSSNADTVYQQVNHIIENLIKQMVNENCLPSTQPSLKTFFKSEKDT